ncbi:MAG: hypothetical protein ACRD1X_03200 [Vicinamibacteria bacterium]
MNAKQFSKNLGRRVRLRPIAKRQLADGTPLPLIDDEWFVERIEEHHVVLHNLRTDHILELGFDNIREFRSPQFLLLRCQVTLRGISVIIEPFVVPEPVRERQQPS